MKHARLWRLLALVPGVLLAKRNSLFIPFPFPEGDPSEPLWSPDGRFIAFRRTVRGKKEIWRVNADGTGLRRMARPIPPA